MRTQRFGCRPSTQIWGEHHALRPTFVTQRADGPFHRWKGQGRQESNPQPAVLETAALPIELRPCIAETVLPRLSVASVRATTWAELTQLETGRIVTTILFRRVIALLALRALERDHDAVGLTLLRHCTPTRSSDASGRVFRPLSSYVVRSTYRDRDCPERCVDSKLRPYDLDRYCMMLVTTPAPTVRPPSRMAKRSPSSIATGWINSTVIWMLSPGMTISTPSGSSIAPVTSVVRM
jgi:hypothetical protein